MDNTDDAQEEFSELPFPARRARPVDVDVAEDPFGNEFMTPLEETAPQDEVVRRAENSRRSSIRIPKFPTVETMYAAYPDIHRVGKVRVVRIEPKWWVTVSGQRLKVNGILTKHESPMSTGDIERRFGGYKYEVYGMLEKFDRDDPGGPPRLVDIAVAEFEIPQDPVSEQRPIDEDQMMYPFWSRRGSSASQQGQHGFGGGGGSSDWGQVLQFAKEMSKGNGDRTPNTAFETLARQGEMTTQQIQDLARQQITALERRNERLEASLQELQLRMNEKPDNIGSIIQGVAALNQSTRTSASSDELQILRDQHERELSRTREDHRLDLERLTRERDREVDRIRTDADARMERAEDKAKDLRENFERREREIRDEFERRERHSKDEQDRQLKMQAENYERRIEDTRNNHDRELRMLKNMQDNTFQTTAAAHGVELRAAQTELSKLTAELTSKQQLVDAAIADKNRPLMEQVAEVKNIAEALGITSDKDETPIPPTPENAPLYEKLIMALMQKADVLLPQLSALAGKVAVPTNGPSAQAQVPYAMMQAPQVVRGLPPRQVPRMTFSDSSGPPRMQQPSIETLSQAPEQRERQAMSPMTYAPMAPVPYMPPGQQVAQMQPVTPGMSYPMQPAVQMQQQQQAMYPTTPMQSTGANRPTAGEFVKPKSKIVESTNELSEEPWKKFDWIPLPVAEVQGLAATLTKACIEKVEAAALVRAFVDEHGIEVISIIPQVIEVNRFIESVRTDVATRSSVLATGKGKRFLEDVWDNINLTVQKAQATNQGKEKEGSSELSSDESESRPQL